MKVPLIALIIQGIPECISTITLIFVIAGIKLEWRKIILLGFICALIVYIIRLLPITFGTHTIILIGLMTIFLISFFQVPLFIAIKSSLIGYLVLIIVESICIFSLFSLFNINFEYFFSNVTIRILTTLPQVFILFIMSFIIFKSKEGKIRSENC